MKKIFFVAAIIAASIVNVANTTAKSVDDASSVNNATVVGDTATYSGYAYNLVMAGRPIPGSYAASFVIDDETYDIDGHVVINVGVMGDMYLNGNLKTGATGYVTVGGEQLPITATFSNDVFGDNSVTFDCNAVIDGTSITSSFTFSGSK
ncbi:MAG: hypothetical protein LBG96_09245 [Tannerella sp.]|nr:hypothetical protein [Tannerella sp.]